MWSSSSDDKDEEEEEEEDEEEEEEDDDEEEKEDDEEKKVDPGVSIRRTSSGRNTFRISCHSVTLTVKVGDITKESTDAIFIISGGKYTLLPWR